MNDPQNMQAPEAVVSAAKSGDPQAQFQVAKAAFLQDNEDEFRHWIQQAASQDYPPALFRLGIWRLSQTQSPEEIQDAKALVQKSANLGFVNAIRAMVVLNARGAGSLPNWQDALGWFIKALRAKDPRATREAGLLLLDSDGDTELSRALLTHAAAAGDVMATYHIGCLLLEEAGENLVGEGLFWLTQAHASGHILAARELARHQGRQTLAPDGALPGLDWASLEEKISTVGEPLVPFQAEAVLEDPKVRRIKGVLTKWQCDYVIARAASMLQPAVTSEAVDAGHDSSDYRTNSAAKFWTMQQDIVISLIDRKMALAAEVPVDCCEDLVVLNYKPGERYYPHCDSFLPELPEQAAEIELKGQRIRTVLIYLNDELEGGETHFLYPESKIRCERGEALIFENVNEEGDADEHSVHEGLPVTSGQKWLASKWVRDKSQVVF